MSTPRSGAEASTMRLMSDFRQRADLLSGLIRLEIASIGALESATPHEQDPGYVVLFHEAKTSKQASVEQMNGVLRFAGQRPVETGGLVEPVLRLQTLGLQKASTTALLRAMRMVEQSLIDRYADASAALEGVEQVAVDVSARRARKRWMILTAHIAQRNDGESSHAQELALPLSQYFAGDEDRVCMRCLLDRPGAAARLHKDHPKTYVCAACHAEALAEFPADLQTQIPRWTRNDRRDRVIHKALGRPMKLKAIKEVHAQLAGLPPDVPVERAKKTPAPSPAGEVTRRPADAPASTLSAPVAGASAEEAAYTTLLFDYRSVRQSW